MVELSDIELESPHETGGKPVVRATSTVTLYKEANDVPLGLSFFPHEEALAVGGYTGEVIVRKARPGMPAAGKLKSGDRVLTIGGVHVKDGLHAALTLRESEGYIRIEYLPAPDNFAAVALFAERQRQRKRGCKCNCAFCDQCGEQPNRATKPITGNGNGAPTSSTRGVMTASGRVYV